MLKDFEARMTGMGRGGEMDEFEAEATRQVAPMPIDGEGPNRSIASVTWDRHSL